MKLSDLSQGKKARITGIGADDPELQRRLLELGFQEGVSVEVLHRGRRTPMAVQIADFTIALRLREASALEVELCE